MIKYTKKHYEDIASVVRIVTDKKQCSRLLHINEVIRLLSENFKKDNDKFLEDKFIKACYPIDTWDTWTCKHNKSYPFGTDNKCRKCLLEE